MTADTNVQGGTPAKKGMSRGCLVGLIVGAALLVLIVGASVVCYVKRADIVRAGAVMLVRGVQQSMAAHPEEGVDTVMVNRVADEFAVRLESSTDEELEAVAMVAQAIQPMMQDEKLDSAEAIDFVGYMVELYPDLEELASPTEPAEEVFDADSMPAEE